MSFEFVEVQFFTPTDQDEANYFTGEKVYDVKFDPTFVMPPGLYRVIDSEIFRIVSSSIIKG